MFYVFHHFLKKVLRQQYLPEDEKLKRHDFRTEENIFLYDRPTESVGVATLLRGVERVAHTWCYFPEKSRGAKVN